MLSSMRKAVWLGALLASAVQFAPHTAVAQSSLSLPTAGPVGDRITAIDVVGAQRIDAATVRSYLQLNPGDAFDARRIDASLKALFQTGLFSDVNLQREGSRLLVSVTENAVINRIAFEGNDRINDDELATEIELRPRVVFTRTKVQSDVARIEELYRRRGRFAVKVEPKVIQRDQNRMDLVFEIDEGPLSEVRRIAFVGNRRFTDEQLKAELQTKEARWYRFLSSDDTYDPDRLSFDRELLRRFYLHNGYTDFRVVSAVAELTPNREDFFITFSVDEGERYRFGKVDIVSEIDGLDAASIGVEFDSKEGDWYDAQEIDKTINDITEAVGNLQFAFVEVTPRVRRNKDNLTVDISYVVSEGRRAFVERIDINGNVRTTDEVIRREFELVERDPFNVAKLRRSETRVRDLGFFSKVDVAMQEGSQPDLVNIEVTVAEQSTGELTFAAGFSTSDGPLGEISLRERNLLGKGQDLRLRTQLSGRTQQIDLGFTEPRFLDRDLAAGVDLFRTIRDNQDESSYDEERTGLGLRLGYPLTDELRQTLSYNISRTTVSDVDDDASRVIRDQVGTRIKSSIGQKLTYDVRDSKMFPTEGYIVNVAHEVAGLGGDLRFLRTIVDGTYYYPVAEGWVLSVTGEVGSIGGLNQTVPIYERFFLGGSTLRGFETAGVGPRDTAQGDALGGTRYVRSSVELEFPLGLPEELGVKGRAFVDTGSLDQIDESGGGIVDEFAFRASTGIGLSWRSPLGLIGLDVAFPFQKESYDETESFRISFGTRF